MWVFDDRELIEPRHSMSVIGLPTQKDPSGTTPGLIGKYASPMGVPGEWETGL